MKLNAKRWLYNMLADCIRGGANAVSASSVVSLVDQHGDFSIYHRQFYGLIGAIFIAHFVINLSHYLEKDPLPEIAPEDQTLASRASEPSSKA